MLWCDVFYDCCDCVFNCLLVVLFCVGVFVGWLVLVWITCVVGALRFTLVLVLLLGFAVGCS